MAWTDEPLVAEVTKVRAVHVTEMRNKLNYLDSLCWSDYSTYHDTWQQGYQGTDHGSVYSTNVVPDNTSNLTAQRSGNDGDNYCPRDHGTYNSPH